MADILYAAPQQVLDSNGDPVSGAKLYFYETGTTTALTVYTDNGLTTPHATPIVADANGFVQEIFYGGSTAAKCVIRTSADVELYTLDPVPKSSTSTAGASNISFTPVTGNAATDVQTAIANNTASIVALGTVTSAGKALLNAATHAAQKVLLTVQGYADGVLSTGITTSSVDDGTKSSGTYTPSPSTGNMRHIVNGGAFTLAAPTAPTDYDMRIQVTNDGSAGAITFSGFSVTTNTGALTTTSGDDFFINISKHNGFTRASVEALQ